MSLSATKALELLSAELANNVLHLFVLDFFQMTDQEWCHGVNLVLQQLVPVVSIVIAFVAVKLVVILLVFQHCFLVIVKFVAVDVIALDQDTLLARHGSASM